MADVKDILGVSRTAEKPAEKADAKPKAPKRVRPEGMSREAFALLGDSHPIISTQLVPQKKEVKAKPKPSTKGFVTWLYKPIQSSARKDDLQLFHWVKAYKDAAGRVKEEEDTDYQFAKFNKKVQLLKYNDEEYDHLIRPDSGDWSRAETDYLMELCERFDLRFIVIADRYEFTPTAQPGQAPPPAPPARTIEDLKDRYYTIARRLLIAREGGEAPVANNVLVRNPFNKAFEIERKKAIELMLQRTKEQTEQDNAILAEAKIIEERQKQEAAPKRQNTAAAGGGAAGAAGAGPAGVVSTNPVIALVNGEVMLPEAFGEAPPGAPSLYNGQLQPSKPVKPGVYARGMHTLNLAQSLVSSLPGGQKSQKAFEATLAGDPALLPTQVAPRCATRAVCGAWLALRLELMALHELKRQMQQGRPAGAGDAGAGGQRQTKRKKQ